MTSASPDAVARLLDILGGKARVQAVSTVSALRIPDLLAAGPRSMASLAEELHCEAAVLAPLLRLVAGLGFFESVSPGVYALTEDGRCLCASALGPLAAFVGAQEQWDPWARLRDVCAGGDHAFLRTFGESLYAFLARDEGAALRYDAAIDAFTRHEALELSRAYDFSASREVIDIGGGRGTLLRELLLRWQHLRGVLLDLPHVVDRAAEPLGVALGERVRVMGGDFHRGWQSDADTLLLKHVLHNWDDERALRLLRHCRDVMQPGARLLLIETLLLPDDRADLASILDLEMKVMLDGRERRKPELRRLLQTAGLVLMRTARLGSGAWLLVARAKEDSD